MGHYLFHWFGPATPALGVRVEEGRGREIVPLDRHHVLRLNLPEIQNVKEVLSISIQLVNMNSTKPYPLLFSEYECRKRRVHF